MRVANGSTGTKIYHNRGIVLGAVVYVPRHRVAITFSRRTRKFMAEIALTETARTESNVLVRRL